MLGWKVKKDCGRSKRLWEQGGLRVRTEDSGRYEEEYGRIKGTGFWQK